MMGWSKEERKKRRPEVITAEIDALYGTDTNDLKMWRRLCSDVNVDPVPQSIPDCKKALKRKFVNLVNLIDHRRNRNVQLIVFPDYHSFRKWTLKKSSRIFPKKAAKAGGFIKALLRDLQLH
ncbi:hypothetical protein B5807_00384 [Epicoccum nigrum]|uniref:Uncharacterized protein n=1 Tax=Epicoccum nigrum TaxID=105696 RepID=A0A1Y2MG53_EPING|nr:hypothetical protein B5807_00384 [Epicoccum nigrum]